MTQVTIVPDAVAFEVDKLPHTPSFHFVDKNNNLVEDVEYSIHYTSENSGYDSDVPPSLPEYYAATITITDDKYQLTGKNWIVFHIDPAREGLDYIVEHFKPIDSRWGNDGNGGVYANNVSLNDNNITIKVDGKTRTGGAIVSNDLYSQGSFEFVASTNAKSGVCMAFWTFFYANMGEVNSEIDFELFGQNSIIYSSYTSEDPEKQTHVYDNVDFNIPDNKIHTYRFDWYAGKRVEFYIDEILVCTITENVPVTPMQVWIGAWCPIWAGEPTNEVSTMTLYSFSYKSFD